MQRNRQWRRAQRERKIRAVHNWIRFNQWYLYSRLSYDEIAGKQQEEARRRHSSPASCSGCCCGNPRKHFGTNTTQEHRSMISCIEEFEEYDIPVRIRVNKRRW